MCTPQDQAIFGGFQDYDDEILRNYETGIKANIGNIGLNAAIFRAEIEDLQVTLDAGSCSSRISFNVPEAHSQGIELEFTAQPTDNLSFSIAASVIESEFDSTVRDGNGAILGGVQEGNRLASVPETQFAAAATYAAPLEIFGGGGEWYINATIQNVGDRITQPSDQVTGAGDFVSGLPFGGATGNEVTTADLELDAYTIVNLNAGISKESYDLQLFVNNVTDANANLSFDRERGGRARLGFRTNAPRTVGANIRWRF